LTILFEKVIEVAIEYFQNFAMVKNFTKKRRGPYCPILCNIMALVLKHLNFSTSIKLGSDS
jgi:hypothetical protein